MIEKAQRKHKACYLPVAMTQMTPSMHNGHTVFQLSGGKVVVCIQYFISTSRLLGKLNLAVVHPSQSTHFGTLVVMRERENTRISLRLEKESGHFIDHILVDSILCTV